MKNSIFIGVSALIVCFSMFGCSKPASMTTAEIAELSHSEKYHEIVRVLSHYDICASDDPRKLMMYIEALTEINNTLPKSLQSGSCPSYIREFAVGYHAMLQGRITDSLQHITSIGGSTDATVWSATAFLEHGLYTKDLSNYEPSMRILQGINIYKQKKGENSYPTERDLTYYRCWFLLLTNKIVELKIFLTEKGQDLTLYDKTLLDLEVHLREDEFDKANRILDNQIAKYPKNQTLMLYRGIVIRLTKGDDAWLQYLKELLNSNSNLSLIESHYATGLIEAGQKEKGLQILAKAARKKQFNYENVLLSKYYLILYGDARQKTNALESISNVQYAQLPYYHVILGQLCLIDGEVDNAEKQLNLAKQLNPYADYVLWLEYEILKQSMRIKEAKSVLDEMRRMWPNDIDVLHEECMLAKKLNDKRHSEEMNEILRKSKRVIPFNYLKDDKSADCLF